MAAAFGRLKLCISPDAVFHRDSNDATDRRVVSSSSFCLEEMPKFWKSDPLTVLLKNFPSLWSVNGPPLTVAKWVCPVGAATIFVGS